MHAKVSRHTEWVKQVSWPALAGQCGRSAPQDQASKRRGIVALELLVTLPILLLVILAAIEFSLLLAASSQLQLASREGARVASLGGSQSDVEDTVKKFLNGTLLAKAQIQTVLTDEFDNPLPSGAWVVVLVTIPTNQAVPNLLGMTGFSLGEQVLAGQTVFRKE